MFAGRVGTVPGARGEGDDQPRCLLTPSQPDEGGGAALQTSLSVAALVGVGDGLPCPGPDREGVAGSAIAILRAAMSRSGGKTEQKVTESQGNPLFLFNIAIIYFIFFPSGAG